MWVLVEGSWIPRTRYIWRRYRSRSHQGWYCDKLGSTNNSGRDPEFSWTRRILPEIYWKKFEDCEAYDGVVKEGYQVYMDWGMWGQFPGVEETFGYIISIDSAPISVRIMKYIATLLVEDLEQCLCRKEELFRMPHDSLNLMSWIMLRMIWS